MTNVRVLHTGVGRFVQGDVVDAATAYGDDVSRLVAERAVEWTDAPATVELRRVIDPLPGLPALPEPAALGTADKAKADALQAGLAKVAKDLEDSEAQRFKAVTELEAKAESLGRALAEEQA